MTLLLAFFVLLFAMSNLDVKKYEAFFEGLNGPIDNAGEGTLEGSVEEALPPPVVKPGDRSRRLQFGHNNDNDPVGGM